VTRPFSDKLSACQARVQHALNTFLDDYLASINGEETRLLAAIRYSLLAPGKRVRPMLVYAAAEAIGRGNDSTADWAAVAVECIHAYSLIHDDLPAMDDDDLRRNRPTCHIAFDEATAILAGDALQAMAFEAIARSGLPMQAVSVLARAARRMVDGQAIDQAATNQIVSLEALQAMHGDKTGALISASLALGGMSAGATTEQLEALSTFGKAIGLAFQIQDDILDITATTEELGKPQNSDSDANKATYPRFLGLDGALQALQTQHSIALSSLSPLKGGETLTQLADYIVQRRH
jgi:farnesyl diphosphate synthase/geranylgeranyl diphosphate synthase type II